jgi:hypothetical protein
MLPNGSFATMTVTKGKLMIPLRQDASNTSLGNSKGEPGRSVTSAPAPVEGAAKSQPEETAAFGKEVLYDSPPARVNFEFTVDRAALERSANSWNPVTEPFPVDLRDCIQRAKDHLVLRRQIPGKLILTSVHLGRHLSKEPTELMRKRGKQWEIVTRFSCEKPDRSNIADDELYVVSLLDGTVADETLRSGELIVPFR